MKTKLVGMAALLLLGGALTSACSGIIPVSGDLWRLKGPQATAVLAAETGQPSTETVAKREAVDQSKAVAQREPVTQTALETEIGRLQTQVSDPAVTVTSAPPTATLTPQPAATQTPMPPAATQTIASLPCNMALFVADISIPDGTVFAPGVRFTKTWRLKNAGTCVWTTDYALVFTNGEPLSGPLSGPAGVALPGNVLPGQVIDLSVDLVAPIQVGSYRGDWKLRNAGGTPFGLGPKGSPFYVEIKVEGSESQTPLDFAAAYCQAAWTSGAGQLSCQGDNNDSRGFARGIDQPTLENGMVKDEPALLTHPQMITDGMIRGKYPAVQVSQGYHFAAIIGCAYRADACDVYYQLDYQIGDGPIQNLAAWREIYDGQFDLVDVDLSGLAGQEVNFILTILANGSSAQDRALWLAPHIARR